MILELNIIIFGQDLWDYSSPPRRMREHPDAIGKVNGSNKKIKKYYGAIAQLGERLNGIQEVSGSIPLSSTKKG